MILTVTLNPSVDHALFVDELKVHDTNRVQRTERDAGGKGVNVARVASELGAEVTATGFLGGGPGAYVKEVLKKQGVHNDFIEVDGETRVNFSVEDASTRPPTTFNEPGPSISIDSFESLREHCRRHAKHANWVCLGGSLPPGVPKDAFRILMEDSPDANFVLDADGEPLRLGLEGRPKLIKPNAKECARLLDRPIECLDHAFEAAKELILRIARPDAIVIISRGEAGAVLATHERVLVGTSAPVEARSTIGSGDSMIGGFLYALEVGKTLEEAFRYGLAAGAATATTDGSEIARRNVVMDLLPHCQVKAT